MLTQRQKKEPKIIIAFFSAYHHNHSLAPPQFQAESKLTLDNTHRHTHTPPTPYYLTSNASEIIVVLASHAIFILHTHSEKEREEFTRLHKTPPKLADDDGAQDRYQLLPASKHKMAATSRPLSDDSRKSPHISAIFISQITTTPQAQNPLTFLFDTRKRTKPLAADNTGNACCPDKMAR